LHETTLALKLAQGILCGPWALAFPFDWARLIVEQFELSPIPKSPDWLLGAANVEGNIVPVVDLAKYLGVSGAVGMPVSTSEAQRRLLIGGMLAGAGAEEANDAVALLFEGLPQQLNYEERELSYASALPPRLRELCVGVAKNAAGHEFLEVDAQKMLAAFSDELVQQ
jgi:chemotaxis signal transduction protein